MLPLLLHKLLIYSYGYTGKNEKVQVFKYFIIQLACEGDNETGGRWQNLKMINERHYFLEQRQSTLMNSRGK